MLRGGKPYDGGNSIASHRENLMLTVRLPENIERRLDRLARATGSTCARPFCGISTRSKIRSKPKRPWCACARAERVFSSEEVGKMLDWEERGELA